MLTHRAFIPIPMSMLMVGRIKIINWVKNKKVKKENESKKRGL